MQNVLGPDAEEVLPGGVPSAPPHPGCIDDVVKDAFLILAAGQRVCAPEVRVLSLGLAEAGPGSSPRSVGLLGTWGIGLG